VHHRSSQSLSCIIGSWITGMNDRLWFVYSGNFIMGHNLHLLLSLFYRSITYRRFLGSTDSCAWLLHPKSRNQEFGRALTYSTNPSQGLHLWVYTRFFIFITSKIDKRMKTNAGLTIDCQETNLPRSSQSSMDISLLAVISFFY